MAVGWHVGRGQARRVFFWCSLGAIRALRRRLDARFARYSDSRRPNPWYDLTFVCLPATYHLFNNSNQRTAAWLGELGVAVRGLALWSRWRVEGP